MKMFEITDIKAYLNELFAGERFESFYLYELRCRSDVDYYVSGKKSSPEEAEYAEWGALRKKLLAVIGTEELPKTMKLVLMFNRDNITRLIEMNNIPLSPESVGGLFININLDQNGMSVTAGTSIKEFTMDKTLEHTWDSTVEKYYTLQ